jgi:NarL family two-component system response regulator YdfI
MDQHLFTDTEWTTLVRQLKLSPQQARIVKALLDGLGDKQIASRLHIKLPTVRMHLSRIFTKLGVNDRTELVVHVFKHFRAEVHPIR